MPRSATHRNPIVLYAASEIDADILYATGFRCPDPFLFVRTASGRRVLVMSDLEIDRAKKQSNAHRVLSFSSYAAKAEKRLGKAPKPADTIAEVLRDLSIKAVTVPGSFGAAHLEQLRTRGVRVTVADGPVFPERIIKTPREVSAIRAAMRITEDGMEAAIDLLRDARVERGWVVRDGKRLTCEDLRDAANGVIFAQGCIPAGTIVAAGKRGCDPHDVGGGPIRAGEPIILDIFPRSEKSGYFADITRTVVKGTPKPIVRDMYDAVFEGQQFALKKIRHGARVSDIHNGIHAIFEKRGFKTGKIKGRMQGFFHGTGHGLGLEIHEAPRVAGNDTRLEAGMVVTVEPGLYYHPHGGVRIEDTVLVTKTGLTNLTRFPKFFIIP